MLLEQILNDYPACHALNGRTFRTERVHDGTVHVGTDKYGRGYIVQSPDRAETWWICTAMFGNTVWPYGEGEDPEDAFHVAADLLETMQ